MLPHEEIDEERALALVDRIRADGVLRNPPIVAPIGEVSLDPEMVVLDGANRVFALKELGMGCILVQVVHYGMETVHLETWAHVINNTTTPALIDLINGLDEIALEAVPPAQAEALLARREAIFSLTVAAGVYVVRGGSNLYEQSRRLLRVVNAYKAQGTINRTTAKTIEAARPLFPNGAGLVVFPNYHPNEVIAAARNRALLPTGITRHVIHGRALRVNYPLAKLELCDSLEAQNARLAAWVHDRAAAHAIRFYAEPTYIFDE
ncbi:MAG: hypothetical protein M5R40_11175 [Anaerolineae bacterium]|nr:hypothetical protein [Anaerolineae bacterium]